MTLAVHLKRKGGVSIFWNKLKKLQCNRFADIKVLNRCDLHYNDILKITFIKLQGSNSGNLLSVKNYSSNTSSTFSLNIKSHFFLNNLLMLFNICIRRIDRDISLNDTLCKLENAALSRQRLTRRESTLVITNFAYYLSIVRSIG